jgi:hypothetical protein
MLKPKLAIATNIVWGIDPSRWRDRLAGMRSWGYRGIAAYDSAMEDGSTEAASTFQSLAHDLGLEVARASATLQPDLPEYADLGARIEQLLDWTIAFGARDLCMVDLLPEQAEPMTERAWVARSTDRWKQVAQRAADRAVRVHWNVKPDNREAPLSAYEHVLRAVDEPNFGLEFDTGVMDVLALATGHEHFEDGKPLSGVLGMLERFKGNIAGITLGVSGPPRADSAQFDDQTSLNWDRLIPALVDAGIPDCWWVVGTEPGAEEWAARRFLDLLAPFLSDAPSSGASPRLAPSNP